jgi:hypothetical protein
MSQAREWREWCDALGVTHAWIISTCFCLRGAAGQGLLPASAISSPQTFAVMIKRTPNVRSGLKSMVGNHATDEIVQNPLSYHLLS